jgi:hypothetical protein
LAPAPGYNPTGMRIAPTVAVVITLGACANAPPPGRPLPAPVAPPPAPAPVAVVVDAKTCPGADALDRADESAAAAAQDRASGDGYDGNAAHVSHGSGACSVADDNLQALQGQVLGEPGPAAATSPPPPA